ncbi:MAG: glycosyltransferase [Mitsuaria chitosanitabida]|nr:glycosyltransferase [Roseateles chitosanitabidus]
MLAVVVLYRRAPAQAAAWPELSRWLDQPSKAGDLKLRAVLFHDNSPAPDPTSAEAVGNAPDARVHYRHDPANGGTRAAFIGAAERARALGCDWLLLLDQDTSLPPRLMDAASTALAATPGVAALVPRVLHGETPISPAVIADTGIIRPLPLERTPRAGARLTAIASGTLLRVEALEALGPLPERLWLDGVDHWIFTRLHRLGRPVRIVACTLKHDLSAVSLSSMPTWRVVSMLESERLLLREWPWIARLARPYRLSRFLMRLRREHPDAFRAALRWLVTGRQPPRPGEVAPPPALPASTVPSTMTAIDILLPVYNGTRFLEAQLDSLLAQTHRSWRCLMRDDGSSDGSSAILRRYQAAHPERFVVIEDGLGNLGTVRCLNALSQHVSAPVFAFCDQDDVWHPEKLSTSVARLQALQTSEATPALVYCDMTVTDAALTPTAPSFWDVLGGRRYARELAGLPVINVVAGCTMVGNRALLEAAFPVPACAPMHDYWVGVVAKFTGAVAAIETPLMLYRQHGRNQCGVDERPSLVRRLASRLLALGAFREQGRKTRALRLAMLEDLIARHHPGLRVQACDRALRAERGGPLRRLSYLLAQGIRPDHAFIYWLA